MGKPDDRDARLANRGASDARDDRAVEDRPVTQNREISDVTRLEAFRAQMFQSTLPNLPDIEGYHTCWLTTSNPRDAISTRLSWGYELIKSSEIPGYETVSVKTGEYAGCIGVNEMLAAKLPIRLYEMYLTEAHHKLPQDEEDKLSATLEVIAEEARRKGAKVLVGDGTAELGQGPRKPKFEGLTPR